MKKLLLFFMAIAFCVAPSCVQEADEVEIPDSGFPTVKLEPVSGDAEDVYTFTSNNFEGLSFYVVVDANYSLYPDADGTELKSWVSSTDNFTVTYERDKSYITVVPSDINYFDDPYDATITVMLYNYIGGATATINVSQNNPTIGTVTFEDGSDMVTPSGAAVEVDDYIFQMATSIDYTAQTFIAKGGEYEVAAGEAYDDVLFVAEDSLFVFGEYFAASADGDYWSGFALGQKSTVIAETCSVDQQFIAFGEPQTGSESFAVAKYSTTNGGTYEQPTISFSEDVTLRSIDIANTAYLYNYDPSATLSADSVFYFYVTITGYYEGLSVGEVSEYLITNDTTRLDTWTTLNLQDFDGEIDQLKFTFTSNDKNAVTGIYAQQLVAFDNIVYIKEWN